MHKNPKINILALNLEKEALERKKIKAEDLADLANKSEDELREIIEKQRITCRDLSDQVNENKVSSEKTETELNEQIRDLNNIITNLKSNAGPRNSVRNITALGALSGKSPRSGKSFPIPPSPNKGLSGTKALLASKLPFGKKKNTESKTSKADKVAAC